MIIKNKVEFDKLFTDFSDAVKEKKYAKMSYQFWNKIKNNLCALDDKKDFVEIKNDAGSIRVQFHINGNVSEFIFSWDDCSFGQFIYDMMNNEAADIKGYASIDLKSVKAPIGVRDKLEKTEWTKEYTPNWKADYMEPSPVDSGEWWGEVDKPLELTYVGDDVRPLKLTYVDGAASPPLKCGDLCLQTSDGEYIKIDSSPFESWKDISITGDCIQPDACSVNIPGYATVESISDAIATKAEKEEVYSIVESVSNAVAKKVDKEEVNTIYDIIDEIKQTAGVGLFDNKKGKNDMKNVFNFDFGPVESECIRMSMYGLAVKNIDGVFVSYDAAAGRLVDVDILNFNGNKFLYKMPVAIKDIKVGDIVVHMRRPVFVTDIQKNSIIAVDPHDGEMKTVLLTRSPFGFDFATKVVNFLGDFSAATPDNPFGNMWMFMMMDGDNKDNMLPLMMMMNQSNTNMNPMMMYMMMQDKGDMKDVLPFMMMMGQNPFAVPAPISAPAVAQ